MTPDVIHVQLREPVRLDVFLTHRLAHVSRNRIQRHIAAGDVLVDGRVVRASHVLTGGETITMPPLEARRRERASEPIELTIVHEDADLVVVDKPAGLLVHPVGREFRRTLLNGLHHRLTQQGSDAAELGIVHRLDRLTSGLIVVAKTLYARRALSDDVEHRRVHRRYIALAAGSPRPSRGVIDLPIRRDPARPTRMQALHPGELDAALRTHVRPAVSPSGYSDPRLDLRPRPARTHYTVLRRFEAATLMGFELETGRTHQIRVHARAIGCPLLGDPIYGPSEVDLDSRLAEVHALLARPALHAARLEFTHPRTGARLRFSAMLPTDIRRAIEGLVRR